MIVVSLGHRKWAGKVLEVTDCGNLHGDWKVWAIDPKIRWEFLVKPEVHAGVGSEEFGRDNVG